MTWYNIRRLHLSLALLSVLAISIAPIAHARPIEPAAHLDPVNRTLWSDETLGLRFTYPPVWEQGTATQSATRVVITWRLTKSKALLAACYIETHGPGSSSIANLGPSDIHSNFDSIKNSALRNYRSRAPNARLIEARAAMQDGHPVIFLVRDGTVENLDRRISNKSYSLITAWKGTEVNFECGTPIYGPEYLALEGGSNLINQIEAAILNVIMTLQFDRAESNEP